MAEWFAPKRYGYGAGLPIAWQGWALLAADLATAIGAAAGLRTVRKCSPQFFSQRRWSSCWSQPAPPAAAGAGDGGQELAPALSAA